MVVIIIGTLLKLYLNFQLDNEKGLSPLALSLQLALIIYHTATWYSYCLLSVARARAFVCDCQSPITGTKGTLIIFFFNFNAVIFWISILGYILESYI
jgi:hypothetical protein